MENQTRPRGGCAFSCRRRECDRDGRAGDVADVLERNRCHTDRRNVLGMVLELVRVAPRFGSDQSLTI